MTTFSTPPPTTPAYFIFGSRRLLGKQRRNVLPARDKAASLHLSRNEQRYCPRDRAAASRVGQAARHTFVFQHGNNGRRRNYSLERLRASKLRVKTVLHIYFHFLKTGCLQVPRARVKGTVQGLFNTGVAPSWMTL